MYQYDDPTVVSAMPTPAAAGTPGYFTDGSPAQAQPATILRADYMNMMMMELLNIVMFGGISPSKTAYNQVLAALKAKFALLDGSNAFTVSPSIPNATQSGQAASLGQIVGSAGMHWSKGSNVSVNLSNGASSPLQSLAITLPNGLPGTEYRLVASVQSVFNQQAASSGFQNIQNQIGDGSKTYSGAAELLAGVNTSTFTYALGDVLILGPYSPGAAVTLTQGLYQGGGQWNAAATIAYLDVLAVLSAN